MELGPCDGRARVRRAIGGDEQWVVESPEVDDNATAHIVSRHPAASSARNEPEPFLSDETNEVQEIVHLRGKRYRRWDDTIWASALTVRAPRGKIGQKAAAEGFRW